MLKKLVCIYKSQWFYDSAGQVIENVSNRGIEGKLLLASVFSCEPFKEADGVLFVTDCGETAKSLLGEQLPVLGCISPAMCQEEDFSGIKYVCQEIESIDLSYFEGIYRRYAGIPWDILETQRCKIRETCVEDVDAFYEIYKEPQITRYMEDLYADPAQEKAYIRDYIEKIYGFYDIGVWTVLLKETGEIIGRAGLSYREGFEEPELGFVIGVPWQRKGLAFEVCTSIIKYGWEVCGFSKVQAFVEPGNEISMQLCEKLGFCNEGPVSVEGQEFIRYLYSPQISSHKSLQYW